MRNLNKTIVITGATSGIGLATAKELAGMGAYIIGVGRTDERCIKAEEEIKRASPGAKVCFLRADLSSMDEVAGLADKILSRLASDGIDHLDVLINNAGAVSSWYVSTVDGYELQFAVNHLAPFRLTCELMPLLQKSGDGIVIVISSGSHYRTKIHWKDVMMRRRYNCLLAYKQSKLANVLFATELNRRLFKAGSGVRAFAVDPGLVNTDIGLKGTGGIVKKVWEIRSRGGVSAETAARSVAFIAADPAVRSMEGVYWKNCAPVKPSRYSQREDEGRRLWELSERMCGISFNLNCAAF